MLCKCVGCAKEPGAKWASSERERLNYVNKVEELLMAMEKVKQELESMKAKLSCTQQSLAEKETHLTNLRAERRKHLEEVLEMKHLAASLR
ncbi:ELKS/Rab6-interacting/CAST family member 1-like isoform 2-T2 [Megaptera novaeangliae]